LNVDRHDRGLPGALDSRALTRSRPGNLTDSDLALLAASWITPALAEQAQLRRVSAIEGAEVIGQKPGPDYAGVVYPYIRPGATYSHLERLRLDHPPIETRNGVQKPSRKYLTASGRGNNLYFVPGTPPSLLTDTSVSVVVTEGEKKGIALYRAAFEGLPDNIDSPRFLPVALPGAWNWRGKIGRQLDSRGVWVEEKGAIPDLDMVTWAGRQVIVIFDSNAASNDSVYVAQSQLAAELTSRGAEVFLGELPTEDGINGVDDYLAKYGLEPTLSLIRTARLFRPIDRLVHIDYSDAGNEEAFQLLYGEEFLFNRTTNQWLQWNGNIWAPDMNGSVDRHMLDVAHVRLQSVHAITEDVAVYASIGDTRASKKRAFKEALKLRNVRGRQSALLSATTNPKFARRAEDFNQDPYLFSCSNGVIDPRTGEFRPGLRQDMMTMRTEVPWIANASYARWQTFLSDVFPDRPDMLRYLQRAIGYSLTGLTREECFWILHGSGRNGKGVFLRILMAVLGDYGNTCEFSTLVADRDRGRSPRNDIAALVGKRFVSAQEAREGCQLDEALIKSLTGGDLITARFLHQEFFTFRPTWKIWLAVNHRPEIRGTDTGIWSRPRLVPFTVSFEGRENRKLKEELLEPIELAGVLRWAIEGCQQYLENGLDAPYEVIAATNEYRAECDVIGRFLEECCVTCESSHAKARDLYRAFCRWAEASGEESLTETAFGRRMTERGMERQHKNSGKKYLNIALRMEANNSMTGCEE
jgi:putative DNA primase/helicase